MRAKYFRIGLFSAALGISAGSASAQILVGYGPHSSITPAAFAGGNWFGPDFVATAFDITGNDFFSLAGTLSFAVTGSETIWITETGNNFGAANLTFSSGFSQNVLPHGATVTETTYFDPSDAAFGITDLLQSASFSAPGGAGPLTNTFDVLGSYSLTEEYVITVPLPVPPTALSTISLDTTFNGVAPHSALPETSTWAMLGVGFAAVGLLGMTKRRKVSRYAL